MKRKVFLIVASLLLCGTIFAQDFHWSDFNYHNFTSHMNITGRVYLDGVLQQDRGDIEVAAFVGDELRGTKFLVQPYPNSNLGYFIWAAAYYNTTGETFTFKAFDHASGIEYDICPTQLTGIEGDYGSVNEPVNMYFTTSHVPFVGPTYPWTPSTEYSGEGMTVVAQIQINGELLTSANWEVGAFCNGECRGTCDGLDDWTEDDLGFFAFMTIVGNDGDVIEFYLYDKTNEEIYEAICATTVDMVNGGELGIDIFGGDIFVLDFVTEHTFTKTIKAYNGDSGYYLVASPVGEVSPEAVTNMLSNSYDFYYFDQEQTLEWINYEDTDDGGYNMLAGKGYLYANSQTVTLTFKGYPTYNEADVTLTKSSNSNVEFQGWNLVGNPLAEPAFIGSRAYYRMSDNENGGNEIVPATIGAAIAPMEGIFVIANNDGENLTFSSEAPNKEASLMMNISRNRGSVIDRAIVRFGNDGTLPKFMINSNHTKLYIPQDTQDYAVVSANADGVMPVNFKAAENGTYTFSVNAQEISFRYLHLIDNLTGTDTDLLATPSYSFNANTTDYASRFKLVFITGNADEDDITFFNGSQWVINNEGHATLQVIDVLGRILSSESINGCVSISIDQAPGVYVIRLLNGENVRTQKIIIK